MNLFIGNLNPVTNAEGLRKLFSEYGEIVSTKVIMDNPTGTSRGFGFVEMADKFHAMDAIDNIDGTFFEGNIISVKEAKQSTNAPTHRGGGGSFNRGARPGGGGYNKPSGGGGYGRPGGGGGFGQGGGNSPSGRPYRPRVPRQGGTGGNSQGGSSNNSSSSDDDRFNRL